MHVSHHNFQEKLDAMMVENNQLKQQVAQYKTAYDCLQSQVQALLRHRFGQRSERFIDPLERQKLLFDEGQLPVDSAEAEQTNTTDIPAHTRRKKKIKNTDHLPRSVVIIPVDEADKICACGCEKAVIRHEIKELYDYKPAVFQIIEQRREVVACPKGCEASIQTAKAPLQVLPKIKATESLLAHIIVSKLHDRQPLYHLEKYGRAVDVSRETMARWMIQLKTPLMPIFNLMKDRIIDYDIASIDATSLQVLKEPGRSPSTKSYVYCIRGGPAAQSVVLYGYNHEKHKQYVDSWLEGFQGAIHMDADNFFETLLLDKAVFPSFCNAHARRYFETVKKQAKKQGLAHEALRYYKKLYCIERHAKEKKFTAEARYALRQKESKPILLQFKAWLDQHAPLTLPKSPLGKAFFYAIKHWAGLCLYLEDGRLEIDNNLTEQEIKPLVIARKNFMFSNSMEGAHALCLHFSLIRTALTHQLDPFQYYVALLKQIPHCSTVEAYEALLPWKVPSKLSHSFRLA